jgi:hypothetical protein
MISQGSKGALRMSLLSRLLRNLIVFTSTVRTLGDDVVRCLRLCLHPPTILAAGDRRMAYVTGAGDVDQRLAVRLRSCVRADQPPLELGQAAEDGEEQRPVRRGGVCPRRTQGGEPGAFLGDSGERVETEAARDTPVRSLLQSQPSPGVPAQAASRTQLVRTRAEAWTWRYHPSCLCSVS